MATAMASALSGRPVLRDVAMTGEITLRGRVLPIGGVKEKVLGAHRAGITRVILPRDNEADLEDIPDEVRSRLEFHCVSTLDEAFDLALARPAGPRPSRTTPAAGQPGRTGRWRLAAWGVTWSRVPESVGQAPEREIARPSRVPRRACRLRRPVGGDSRDGVGERPMSSAGMR